MLREAIVTKPNRALTFKAGVTGSSIKPIALIKLLDRYRSEPASRTASLINRSEIDFEALQAKFARAYAPGDAFHFGAGPSA